MSILMILAVVLQLSWQDNSGEFEDGFKIQMATSCTIVDGKATSGVFADVGQVAKNVTTFTYDGQPEQCFRVYAFNLAGASPFSNVVQAPKTPPPLPFDVVSITAPSNLTFTVSRRSTDTSTVYSIVVNKTTVIGPGGIEIAYPTNRTLLISRRGNGKSSVVALLVNKTTTVIINGLEK